jgi:hypothetical protein
MARFLQDMLRRYTRQVLASGKASESVSDAGGPISGHSVFTGHFITALKGAAATPDGVLVATHVMQYTYEHVANDVDSNQTPHFGYLDGEGDFIFEAPILAATSSNPAVSTDILVESTAAPITQSKTDQDPVGLAKGYIAEPRSIIKLDDLISDELRRVKGNTTLDRFPVVTETVTPEELTQRLGEYENLTRELRQMIASVAYWGEASHLSIIRKAVARLAECADVASGEVAWIELRWYPTLLLLYTAGIAAVAAGRFEALHALFSASVNAHQRGEPDQEAVVAAIDADLELQGIDIWKTLPGHERNLLPRSEYLFEVQQPDIERLLFLGKSYEQAFDRFEVFLALVYAYHRPEGSFWGPPGRFVWQYKRRDRAGSPLVALMREAEMNGDNWPPLKAGLFGGSLARFTSVAQMYVRFIETSQW